MNHIVKVGNIGLFGIIIISGFIICSCSNNDFTGLLVIN